MTLNSLQFDEGLKHKGLEILNKQIDQVVLAPGESIDIEISLYPDLHELSYTTDLHLQTEEF